MEHVGRAHVAIGFADGSVRVIATGSKARPGKARVQVLRGHPESVLALSGALSQAEAPAWPRTGGAAPERLLSADVGATVLMWDCERWACVGRWRIRCDGDRGFHDSLFKNAFLETFP